MLRVAGRPGPMFALDASADNVLGRSPAALVVLADRLASRAHAAVSFDARQGRWLLRDLGSRNGTWLDGLQVTSATLEEGSVVRVGTSEFVFRQQSGSVSVAPAGDRIVRRGPSGRLEAQALSRSGSDAARWPMLLYQASIRMLATTSPDEIVSTTLELAAEFSAADACGWFRLTAAAELEAVCVVPPGSDLIRRLDEAGVDALASAGEAAWCGPTAGSPPDSAGACDVICVPLLAMEEPHAALAASAPAGTMRDIDFEILVALASLASAAWAGRGRRSTTGPSRIATGPRIEDDDGGPPTDDVARLAVPASDGGTLPLTAEGLRNAIEARGEPTAAQARIGNAVAETSSLRLEEWQRALVVEALRRTGGSVPNAAAELGVSRATLYRKLEAYGLTRR